MSRSYWIKHAAAGLASGILLFAPIALAALGADEPHSAGEYAYSPAERYSDSEANQPPAGRAAVQGFAPSNPASGQRDTERAPGARDNTAQKEEWLLLGDGAAQWLMTAIGLFTLILSGIAVWLLRRTLDATEAAVEQAKDGTRVAERVAKDQLSLGQIQMRAYVAIENAAVLVPTLEEIDKRQRDGLTVMPQLSYSFKNYGNSPALNLTFGSRVKYLRLVKLGGPNARLTERASNPVNIMEFKPAFRTDLIPPGRALTFEPWHGFGMEADEIEALKAGAEQMELWIYFAISARYDDVFGVQIPIDAGFVCAIDPSKLGERQEAGFIDPAQVDPMEEVLRRNQENQR